MQCVSFQRAGSLFQQMQSVLQTQASSGLPCVGGQKNLQMLYLVPFFSSFQAVSIVVAEFVDNSHWHSTLQLIPRCGPGKDMNIYRAHVKGVRWTIPDPLQQNSRTYRILCFPSCCCRMSTQAEQRSPAAWPFQTQPGLWLEISMASCGHACEETVGSDLLWHIPSSSLPLLPLWPEC